MLNCSPWRSCCLSKYAWLRAFSLGPVNAIFEGLDSTGTNQGIMAKPYAERTKTSNSPRRSCLRRLNLRICSGSRRSSHEDEFPFPGRHRRRRRRRRRRFRPSVALALRRRRCVCDAFPFSFQRVDGRTDERTKEPNSLKAEAEAEAHPSLAESPAPGRALAALFDQSPPFLFRPCLESRDGGPMQM